MFFKKNKDLNSEQHETMTLLEKLCSLISTFYCFVENVCNPGITEEQAEKLKKLLQEDTNKWGYVPFTQYVIPLCLGTVKEFLVTSTSSKCLSAKIKIAGIVGKGIKGNALYQDFLIPQVDI